MSQATTWGNPTSGPSAPSAYAAQEKQSFDALLSMHSGSSRPAYAVVGTQWADTSVSGKIAVKVYDGIADRLIYTIDIATGTKTFAAFDLAADPSSAMQPATKQYADTRVSPQIQQISASVASNALTIGYTPQGAVSFRNPTLNNGAPVSATPATLSLTVPSGATLGAVNGGQSQVALLLLYNAGNIVPAVINLAGGINLDETGLISTTVLDTASDSAGVAYSATAITNSPYRVAGVVTSTQATAGTWATAPSLVQGAGGQALTKLMYLESIVRVSNPNGHGSTANKIKRFTTVHKNQGADITYADSASLGATFTINTSGRYAISYSDSFNSLAEMGISLNSANLTTNIVLCPASEILAVMNTFASGYMGFASWAGPLPAGSIIRAHTAGNGAGANVNGTQFTIARID